MIKMVRYNTGEIRVEDRETMRCSEWLSHEDIASPLEDYHLDNEIGDEEPEGTIVR